MPLEGWELRTKIFVVAALVFGSMTLTACTSTPSPSEPTPRTPASATPSQPELVDPLSEISDVSSALYREESANPVLHVQGHGPATYTFELEHDPVAVEYFLACTPQSQYKVTASGFFASGCINEFNATGQIPVSTDEQEAGRVKVTVDIAEETTYWFVGIPVFEISGG
ncbi:hypothetical protein [Glutamicibacter sp. PS]|uniref:hypothetical protein n=1 Tax=Glutamicibacter sp. PS TaxID=3075634 RepID=UPI0028421A3B|nr:hypothetical protein [Glutamicibacter sp. PS]MDR4533559.1 hypothetical protein [Glutamicibacter sp. PS]